MPLVSRLRIRLDDSEEISDALLEELLETARDKFLELRYPVSPYPADGAGNPIIEPRWNGWLLSAAVEICSKIGIEGQTGHNENSINRTYESADLSLSLCRKVTPICGVVEPREAVDA